MKECMKCGKQTNSCLASDIGWLCYQCYDKHKPEKSEKKNNSHEEDDIQAEFFRLIPLFFPTLPEKLLFAVPNGGKRDQKTVPSKNGAVTFSPEALRMKRQGVKRGVSDVILLIPNKQFSALCIEFKTNKGKQSEEQQLFQQQALKVGNKYNVCRSAMEGIETVREYLLNT